ncbi:hypothetical protein ALNOE001_03140 [Candidatus Methanobinarius endosymbioticus]|uniref:Uncharacterized protein n=1 Tax=Candidatus Methanobinarius endosymbioticus TaxID=2006182 RepID=A0A366MDL4_9EURY|nr:hypothetical protein ALNOE001_03140 [Candidatus Methanobinarius endosymbioticus]
MSEISDNVTFRRDSGEKIEVLQKYVGLKARQEGILTVNFRTPPENIDEIKTFFTGFKASESLTYDIGETGEVKCYFKGMAPLLQQTDEAGFGYSFLSVTLQELQEEYDDDELPSCGCG